MDGRRRKTEPICTISCPRPFGSGELKSKGQNLKTKKRRQPLLYGDTSPDLIHIPIKFHRAVSNDTELRRAHECLQTDGHHYDVIHIFFQNGHLKAVCTVEYPEKICFAIST